MQYGLATLPCMCRPTLDQAEHEHDNCQPDKHADQKPNWRGRRFACVIHAGIRDQTYCEA